VTKKTRSYNYI